jgi:hypothetical protein
VIRQALLPRPPVSTAKASARAAALEPGNPPERTGIRIYCLHPPEHLRCPRPAQGSRNGPHRTARGRSHSFPAQPSGARLVRGRRNVGIGPDRYDARSDSSRSERFDPARIAASQPGPGGPAATCAFRPVGWRSSLVLPRASGRTDRNYWFTSRAPGSGVRGRARCLRITRILLAWMRAPHSATSGAERGPAGCFAPPCPSRWL